MKAINVTKNEGCQMCEAYRDNTDKQACPDHEAELEAKYDLTEDDQDHYFGTHYGDMPHYEDISLTSQEENY